MGLPFTKVRRTEKELVGGGRPHRAHLCPWVIEDQHGDSAGGCPALPAGRAGQKFLLHTLRAASTNDPVPSSGWG